MILGSTPARSHSKPSIELEDQDSPWPLWTSIDLKTTAITSFLHRKVGMAVINSLVTFGLPM